MLEGQIRWYCIEYKSESRMLKGETKASFHLIIVLLELDLQLEVP